MPKVELTETPEPAAEKPVMVSLSAGSLLMSVIFWLTLLTASILYAAVALSPKLADWINVRQQYMTNAGRLKQLDDEVEYLERVAAALKSDPEFAKRLVRASQNPGSGDTEFLPVSQDLLFGGAAVTTVEEVQVVQPAIANVVYHLASHHQHRTWLLAAASGLTLSAFTLLNDAGVGMMRAVLSATLACLRAVTARYRRPVTERQLPSPEPELEEQG